MDTEISRMHINQFIRRRKKIFLTIFFILFLTGLVVAIAMPPVYTSEATIRIDDQEVPEGFVQPTRPDFAEQRIGKINQQVLSRPHLKAIIEEFNLYSENENQINSSDAISKFRENIHMETIVSEMQSKPGGKTLSFTLAFNLSYEGKDPETVQAVTDKLANLYIEEDMKRRERVMTATTDFLNAELKRIKLDIESQEKKISDFKEKHLRELPSEVRVNIQTVARLERELDKTNIQLRNLNERKIFLVSQLANVEPLIPIIVEGDKIATNPSQRLKELNIQLTKLKSIYSEKHPDIKKIKREISELETKIQSSDASVEKVKRLQYLENKLVSLESKLGKKHPDVTALKKEIAALSSEINNLMTKKVKLKISEEKPDNPAYITLLTEINAIDMEIQAIKEDEKSIIKKMEEYQSRIDRGPNIEKELNALTLDYETSKSKYREILNEQMAAQVFQNVEDSQRGQKFIIASPAYLPTEPFKPNRLGIILVSLVLAIGTSFIFAAFQESLDNSIKTTDQIGQITGAPVLTSLSFIVTDREKKIRLLKRITWSLLFIMCAGTGLYVVNQYVIKLYDLWSIISERLKMIA